MNSQDYYEFISKFEERHTTDDCYTPPVVYDVVAEWVAEEYNLNPDSFVRPFVPNGDYQAFEYAPDAVVVDNPPFSILAQIIDFYTKNKIRFFLFAPGLTTMSHVNRACVIGVGSQIKYDNGARVSTSFVTNLDTCATRTAPELYSRLRGVQKPPRASVKPTKFVYPDQVLTSSMLNRLCANGVRFSVPLESSVFVRSLDSQRARGKSIFGGGLLLAEKAAAEKAAAEKAAEKAAAEKAAAEKAAEKAWNLSDRERGIISGLG